MNMKVKYLSFALLGACCVAHGVESTGGMENTDCETSRQAYSGFYAGAGISYQQDRNDVKCSDNFADFYDAKNANGLKLNQQKENKFGGTLNFGYGKCIGALYLGLDADVDIYGNKETSEKASELYGTVKTTTQGIVPALAVRIGAHIAALDVLACLRAGITRVDSKVKLDDAWDNVEWKVKKIVPVVGLSFEKMMTEKFALKLEGDYRFKAKGNFVRGNRDINPSYKLNVSSELHGYNVRLVGVYHF